MCTSAPLSSLRKGRKHGILDLPSMFNLTSHFSDFFILFKCITFIYLCVHEWSRHTIHVEVKGQLAGTSSGLPPYSSQSLFPTICVNVYLHSPELLSLLTAHIK